MIEKDINNLKEMLVDFNEYSTDYTKTRCRELEETIENTLKEIERLNNIINEFDKLIENEINESKLEDDYERVDSLEYCLATLKELKGSDK